MAAPAAAGGAFPVLTLATLDAERRAALVTRAASRLDDAAAVVAPVLADIRRHGDEAVERFLREVDRAAVPPSRFVVEPDVVADAPRAVPPDLLAAMRRTVVNLERFHRAQAPRPWEEELEPGVTVGERFPPLASAGLYVPFGKAVYPSSALMLTVPARVAGVPRIVLASGVDPRTGEIPAAVLAAASLGGATEIWRLSGTPAVAAFAYGTARLPPVDLVAGPGGRYVEAAKRLVRGTVGVDFDAGPSETLVLALDDADPELVAADLLAEAEHGPDSAAIAVATSPDLAAAIARAVARRAADLPEERRRHVWRQGEDGRSAVVVAPGTDAAIAFADEVASEHVVVHARDAEAVARRIQAAGTVCVGSFTPTPAGSYVAGTNHVLPTGGAARYTGGIATTTFLRRQSFERLTEAGLAALRPAIAAYAAYEGLPGHLAAVDARVAPDAPQRPPAEPEGAGRGGV